jgi:hypothetical protein
MPGASSPAGFSPPRLDPVEPDPLPARPLPLLHGWLSKPGAGATSVRTAGLPSRASAVAAGGGRPGARASGLPGGCAHRLLLLTPGERPLNIAWEEATAIFSLGGSRPPGPQVSSSGARTLRSGVCGMLHLSTVPAPGEPCSRPAQGTTLGALGEGLPSHLCSSPARRAFCWAEPPLAILGRGWNDFHGYF